MMHDDAIEAMIPWYANGSLAPRDRERVETHLESCAACRVELDAAFQLSAMPEEEIDALLDHVDARHLDDYAASRARLPADLASWIRGHLDTCEVCREALAQLERSHAIAAATLERGGAGPAEIVPFSAWRALTRTVLHPAAAALYLVAAVIAIPAYRVMVEDSPTPGGVVDLVVVSGPLRGDGSEPMLRSSAGRAVLIGLDLVLPDRLAPDSTLELSLRAADGAVAWSASTTLATARAGLERTGIVTVLVPAARIEPGRYRLVAALSDGPGDALLEVPLTIE